jgi:hypothetical protein
VTPALWFFAIALVVILLVDLAFKIGLLPGSTISQGIFDLAQHYPIVCRVGYLSVVAWLYFDFFGWPGYP